MTSELITGELLKAMPIGLIILFIILLLLGSHSDEHADY